MINTQRTPSRDELVRVIFQGSTGYVVVSRNNMRCSSVAPGINQSTLNPKHFELLRFFGENHPVLGGEKPSWETSYWRLAPNNTSHSQIDEIGSKKWLLVNLSEWFLLKVFNSPRIVFQVGPY
jgi:hypothetical protein